MVIQKFHEYNNYKIITHWYNAIVIYNNIICIFLESSLFSIR